MGVDMAYVIATPDLMAAGAADLETIASTVQAAHLAAAPATVAVAPAAADEVSGAIASLFSQQAQDYYAQARQVAASQEQFARNLTASAASYASTEDAIMPLLLGVDNVVRQASGSLLVSAIAYAMWSGTWADFVPEQLQPFVYLPSLVFLLDAFFLYAFWGVVATSILDAV
ncbi:hypothetical protein A5660_12170 [Mycobacterium alsense]|uniref:PE family protein n=1 Tax=Mycobacterium alsense TaxID=324058 RepID=UPI000800A0F6|nr:PE family protein [Mycobacterium alsense]OBI94395.1 hypothetical protein A5660_12170 [Mycobacterium alsense]